METCHTSSHSNQNKELIFIKSKIFKCLYEEYFYSLSFIEHIISKEIIVFLSIFFSIFFFCIMVSLATNTNKQLAKNIWLIQDFSRNISIKVLSKYLQLLSSKCHFFKFSP